MIPITDALRVNVIIIFHILIFIHFLLKTTSYFQDDKTTHSKLFQYSKHPWKDWLDLKSSLEWLGRRVPNNASLGK